MTPAQAAARIDRISRALQRRTATALAQSAQNGVLIAQDMSKGTFSLLTLARMGHPYAVRHLAAARRMGVMRRQYVAARWGVSSISAEYIINKQGGRFLAAWHHGPVSNIGGSMRVFVVNDSPEAAWLKRGTRRMIARPIGPKVAELLRPIAVETVQEAVRKALRTR